MSTETDCVFCRIVAGEIPSRRVHADAAAYAFLDVAPWQRGHTLVVPRTHVPDLTTGDGVMADLGPAIDAVARRLVDRLDADGINLVVSSGGAAGQEVGHLHVHLVPRYADQPGLHNLVDAASAESADLDAILARLTGS